MSDKRLAVLVFMDPDDIDNLRMPDNSWHLITETPESGIETGQIARDFAAALPGVAIARKSRGESL